MTGLNQADFVIQPGDLSPGLQAMGILFR